MLTTLNCNQIENLNFCSFDLKIFANTICIENKQTNTQTKTTKITYECDFESNSSLNCVTSPLKKK